MLTNKGLVEHVEKALAEKWGYVWGTFGQILNNRLLNQKITQYPDGVGKYEDFIRKHWLGKRTADCVGLIKSYMWWTTIGDPVYSSLNDVSANGMFGAAKEKGPINTMPDVPGVCVWKEGHIGVYVGDGQVIEAHGTKHGVIQTPLRGGTPWTHWLKCPYITYVEEGLNWKEILKKVTDSPEAWEKGIETAVKAAKADGSLGDLEIFQYLPKLIEKIYSGR